ncbi:MAG: hypothetical protein AAF517_05835, partial [Planctomycetota bacterium]
MSESAAHRPRRLRRVLLWTIGLSAVLSVSWYTWFRVTEERLLTELESYMDSGWKDDREWLEVAERLMDHGSKKSVWQILAFAIHMREDEEFERFIDTLSESFGSHYVWLEMFSVFEETYFERETPIRDVRTERFWILDPNSRELAAFTERLLRSSSVTRCEFGAQLLPSVTSITRDRKLNLLFAMLPKAKQPQWGILRQSLNFAFGRVGLRDREGEALHHFSKVDKLLLWKTFPGRPSEGGKLGIFLLETECRQLNRVSPMSTNSPNAELAKRVFEKGGWLEQQIRADTNSYVGSNLAAARRRGWVSEARSLELLRLLEDPVSTEDGLAIEVLRGCRSAAARKRLIENFEDHDFAEAAAKTPDPAAMERDIQVAFTDARTWEWKVGALLALGWLRSTSTDTHELIRRSLESDELAGAAAYASLFCGAKFPIARRMVEIEVVEPEREETVFGESFGAFTEDDEFRFLGSFGRQEYVKLIGPESSRDVPWLLGALDDPKRDPLLVVDALGRIGRAAAESAPRLRELYRSAKADSDRRFRYALALSKIAEGAVPLVWNLC